MEEKKLLTEENYKKGKKKVMRIALIVFIVGLLLGGSLIITGLIKTNELKKQNLAAQQVEQTDKTRSATDIQKDIDKVQDQIDEIDKKITDLESEKSRLRNEQQKIFTEDKGYSDRYYAKGEEITTKENEITNLEKEKSKLESSLSDYEAELWKANSGYNDTKKEIEKAKNTISTSKYVPLYMLGGFIIIASSIIALAIYIFGKGREIAAFTTQQAMPVVQEGMEKMTPTVGNMAETISKGIAKGIKDGTKDNTEEKEKN